MHVHTPRRHGRGLGTGVIAVPRSKDDDESAIRGIPSITFGSHFFLISDIQLVTRVSALDISGTLPSAKLTACFQAPSSPTRAIVPCGLPAPGLAPF